MERKLPLLDRLLLSAGASRAVLFSVSAQAWMAVIGPATTLVIVRQLDPLVQGFYYTFSSLLALQVLFELGLATVIVQNASHEWARLRLAPDGSIDGAPEALSRLASLARFSLRWYATAAVLFVIALLWGGRLYFAAHAQSLALAWWLPWIMLVIGVGLYLLMQPLFSLVEGGNQVDSLYGVRLVQSIVASLGTVGALALGAGLFALAVGAWLRLFIGAGWLAFHQRGFFRLLFIPSSSADINWRREVWPFQWRIALSWLAGYIAFSLIVPTMFQLQGPLVAGQVGMSLVIAGAVDSIAMAWLTTRSPQFGLLVARRNFQALDELFARSIRSALCVAVAGALAVVCGVALLQAWLPAYGFRVLPLWPFILLVTYRVANLLVTGMALYLRAHKQEPFMGISLVNACFVGLALWWAGREYGATGAIMGSLAVTLCWTLPMGYRVFQRSRVAWHGEV